MRGFGDYHYAIRKQKKGEVLDLLNRRGPLTFKNIRKSKKVRTHRQRDYLNELSSEECVKLIENHYVSTPVTVADINKIKNGKILKKRAKDWKKGVYNLARIPKSLKEKQPLRLKFSLRKLDAERKTIKVLLQDSNEIITECNKIVRGIDSFNGTGQNHVRNFYQLISGKKFQQVLINFVEMIVEIENHSSLYPRLESQKLETPYNPHGIKEKFLLRGKLNEKKIERIYEKNLRIQMQCT